MTDTQVRKDSLMYSVGYRCVSVVQPRVYEAPASVFSRVHKKSFDLRARKCVFNIVKITKSLCHKIP